jgi:large subunit ribosomal protein L5
MNVMQNVRIEKITLNVGAGKDQKVLEKGLKLLEKISGRKPVKTVTNKRIASWGLRPGLPVGCKVTLRKKDAIELLPRLLHAKTNRLQDSAFDDHGNISFGIPEHIDIKGSEYDPEIGIIGLQACVTLGKPGRRIGRRRHLERKVPRRQQVTKDEAIKFLKEQFKVKIGEEA